MMCGPEVKRANASERLVYRIPNRGAASPTGQRGQGVGGSEGASGGPRADGFF
jgi:hypothetical protein